MHDEYQLSTLSDHSLWVRFDSGASQGLGHATATQLDLAHASVFINYFPDADGIHAKQAIALAKSLGDRAVAVPADIRKDEDAAKLIEAAHQTFGSLDILVNNAAILRDKTMKENAVYGMAKRDRYQLDGCI